MYRIIQWGTGNVGRHALRAIVERPDFELVGLRVYNPDKVGMDAGELLGGPKTGVIATDDIDAILAIDADCVSYNPLGTTLDGGDSPTDDICRLLASGKNVVSSAMEYHAYMRSDALPARSREARDRIEAACDAGGTSFFHIGINPGFAMDLWPMFLSRVSRRIDRITAVEIVDMARYTSRHMVVDTLGFGLPPETVTPLDHMMSNERESPYFVSMIMLADALGIELDDVTYHRDAAVTDRDLTIAAGTIDAGTVAAMKFTFDGVRRGTIVLSFEFVWRLTDDIAPEWPTGDSRWLVRIEGDPHVESELTMATTEDEGRATSLSVATLCLNAIPSVCAAAPGPLDNLTMPMHAGGYFL